MLHSIIIWEVNSVRSNNELNKWTDATKEISIISLAWKS